MTEPALRVSDTDRQQLAEQLRHHYAAGRLSLAEYEDRVGVAYAARTGAELAALMVDLPAEPVEPAQSPRQATGELDRCLMICLFVLCPPAGLVWWLTNNRRSHGQVHHEHLDRPAVGRDRVPQTRAASGSPTASCPPAAP